MSAADLFALALTVFMFSALATLWFGLDAGAARVRGGCLRAARERRARAYNRAANVCAGLAFVALAASFYLSQGF